MKNLFPNPVASLLSIMFLLLLTSCDTSEANIKTVIPGNGATPVTQRDTSMPHGSVKAVMAATDSMTLNARTSTRDSIGSKISIHHGKVKVVDTTKKD